MKEKKSFTQSVINYMKKGRTLTVLDAWHRFGSFKLSTRLSELARKGYDFERKWKTVKTRYGKETEIAVYKMVKFPKP